MRPPVRPLASRLIVMMGAAAFLIGCAAKHASEPSTTGTRVADAAHSRRHQCDRSDQDTTSAAHAPVFLACAVDTPVRLREQRLRSDFTPQMYDRACYSATLSVIVDASGMPEPETVRTIRYTNRAFADATLATVPGFRFEPAVLAGTHVRQIFEWTSSMTVQLVGASGYGPPQPMPGRAPCSG